MYAAMTRWRGNVARLCCHRCSQSQAELMDVLYRRVRDSESFACSRV